MSDTSERASESSGTPIPPGIGNQGVQTSPSNCQSCRGCLFFSRSLKAQGRKPVCLGISRMEDRPGLDSGSLRELKNETDPKVFEDFKFVCVGYALYKDKYDKTSTRQGAGGGEPGTSVTANSDLPLCAGIEVLSFKAHETHGGTQSAALPEARESTSSRPAGYPQNPTGNRGGIFSRVFSEEFATRYVRSAGLIANRCGTNLKNGVSAVASLIYPDRGRPK